MTLSSDLSPEWSLHKSADKSAMLLPFMARAIDNGTVLHQDQYVQAAITKLGQVLVLSVRTLTLAEHQIARHASMAKTVCVWNAEIRRV